MLIIIKPMLNFRTLSCVACGPCYSMTWSPKVHPWVLALAPSRRHSDSALSSLFPFRFFVPVHDCAHVHVRNPGVYRLPVVRHRDQSQSPNRSLKKRTRRWIHRPLWVCGRYNRLVAAFVSIYSINIGSDNSCYAPFELLRPRPSLSTTSSAH